MTKAPSSDPRRRGPLVAVGLALLAITVAAYVPALSAGYIWDDPDYVTHNATLRTFGGLVEMWIDRHALPQYYPLVHTTFWVEYQLWGLWWPGYHATNVLLHGLSAIAFWRLLTRLRVPGAALAAAVFAVHPVMVESVAWVTERKNTLSLLMALLSLRAWLETDPFAEQPPSPADATATKRRRRAWAISFTLFVLALLSKSVTCALPAVMVVLVWWKRGEIRWRRDLRPLVPFFVVGLALAMNTAMLERQKVGAVGPDWDYAPTLAGEIAARTLIAGRAVWFYLATLVWPVGLTFIYPRWTIQIDSLAQWLYPAALVAVLLALWLARRRVGRGPLAATLIYVGVLFPALGYFNVYPHRYSFVADHFQYHASLAMLALLAAGIAWLSPRLVSTRLAGLAPIVLLVPVLAVLSFRYTRVYHDATTLWTDVAAKDPRSWIAWTNLGHQLVQRGRPDEAGAFYERALAAAPHVQDVQWNAGTLRARQGRDAEAETHFRRAIEIDAGFVPAYVSLGRLMMRRGDAGAALDWYTQAIDRAPTNADANFALGQWFEAKGAIREAAERYLVAAERRPDDFDMQYNFGTSLLRLRSPADAIEPLTRAAQIRPESAEAWTNLAAAHLATRDPARARDAVRRALAIDPTLEPALRMAQQLGLAVP